MRSHAPHFVIIGTQRGGTTFLYRSLVAHPQVAPAARKELHFFSRFYDRGPDWYCSQFPSDLPRGVITGEASPYYLFHPHAARRLHAYAPLAKLIVLLRNPVDRTYSHYNHEVRIGVETMPFEEALAHEEIRLLGETERMLADESYYSFNHQHFSYLARSRYVEQLRTWLAIFPREQLLILESEHLYRSPSLTVRRVTDFLGLAAATQGDLEAHDSVPMPAMSNEMRGWLTAHFETTTAALRSELGLDCTWMSQ